MRTETNERIVARNAQCAGELPKAFVMLKAPCRRAKREKIARKLAETNLRRYEGMSLLSGHNSYILHNASMCQLLRGVFHES
jgi:hypothetical protein